MRGFQRIWTRGNTIALIVIISYAILAIGAQSGVGVAGQGLDPVLADVRARGVLRVAIDPGYAPFSQTVAGDLVGYDVDLARALAAKLGLRAELVTTGLDAVYDDLASRRADIIISALPYSPDQAWRARFSAFYFDAGQLLVVRADTPVGRLADLAQQRVAVALGSDADTEARRRLRAGATFTLDADYDTAAEVLVALRAGQVTAAIVDRPAFLLDADGLVVVEALTFEPYVLAVAPEAFALHAEVERALAAVRAEGQLEELEARWFGSRGT